MKKVLALGIGCLLAQGAFAEETTPAKALPVLPADCADQIESNGLYCSSSVILKDKVTVTFAAIVSKVVFPTVESVLGRYTNFARWPEYAAASPQKVIEFKPKGSFELETSVNTPANTLRHSYDYTIKVQGIPLLKQSVTGLTYNNILKTPYKGALASLEFTAITDGSDKDYTSKAKGVKSQIGSIHAVACDVELLAVCDETKILLVYTTTAQPDISLAMKIAGDTITAGIEDLLVGMLDESIVDPVVETPVTPPVVETPVTPPVVETPVTPPVVETPVTPPVVETPVTPPVVETPVEATEPTTEAPAPTTPVETAPATDLAAI